MIYLWPTSSSMVTFPETFGQITTPATGLTLGIREGRPWACDNEVFTRKFNQKRFFGFLQRMEKWQCTCLFVVCPVVVGDAAGTIKSWHRWSAAIRSKHWPIAFVAQDGLMYDTEEQTYYTGSNLDWADWLDGMSIPNDAEYWLERARWRRQVSVHEIDWLFVGGTTDWKMSGDADICIRQAKKAGKSVHVGRVNSISRIRHFQLMEVDSVDGTFPIEA